jgi:hypothetical protein
VEFTGLELVGGMKLTALVEKLRQVQWIRRTARRRRL